MRLFATIIAFICAISLCRSATVDTRFPMDENVPTPSFTIDTLAHAITANDTTELQKVTSIFKWIAENISYDTKGYYDLNNIYKGLFQWPENLDSATVYKNYNDKIVEKVLNERVAICDGYTRLFKTLCDAVGLKAEIVLGYVRWYSDVIGEQTKRIHAWNAVKINNHWYLIDPTWASGFSNAAVTVYKKQYDPDYFLTPAESFINDHFPLEPKWQMLPLPISITDFYNQPYKFSGFRKFNVKSFKPANGIIEGRIGDKIPFEVELSEAAKTTAVFPSLKVDTVDVAKATSVVAGGRSFLEGSIASGETKEFYVICDGELLLRYSVKVRN